MSSKTDLYQSAYASHLGPMVCELVRNLIRINQHMLWTYDPIRDTKSMNLSMIKHTSVGDISHLIQSMIGSCVFILFVMSVE